MLLNINPAIMAAITAAKPEVIKVAAID